MGEFALRADEICVMCGHRRGYHDGAGCTDELADGSPCRCDLYVDFHAEGVVPRILTFD